MLAVTHLNPWIQVQKKGRVRVVISIQLPEKEERWSREEIHGKDES